MATIENLLEKFKETYTEEWHNAQYLKFTQHPDNTEHTELFPVLLDPNPELQEPPAYKEITFWDFIYDAPISSNYEEIVNNHKFVTKSETPDGYPMEELKPEEEYISLNCNPQLILWEYEFSRYYKRYLDKIPSFVESGVFLQYLIQRVENEKPNAFKGNAYEL